MLMHSNLRKINEKNNTKFSSKKLETKYIETKKVTNKLVTLREEDGSRTHDLRYHKPTL